MRRTGIYRNALAAFLGDPPLLQEERDAADTLAAGRVTERDPPASRQDQLLPPQTDFGVVERHVGPVRAVVDQHVLVAPALDRGVPTRRGGIVHRDAAGAVP